MNQVYIPLFCQANWILQNGLTIDLKEVVQNDYNLLYDLGYAQMQIPKMEMCHMCAFYALII